MLYVENYSEGKCWKKRLHGEFRKACIPSKFEMQNHHQPAHFYLFAWVIPHILSTP